MQATTLMHYAFDIDGTITAHPKELGAVMQSLKASGHRISVLTGAIDAGGESHNAQKARVEARQAQLRGLGIVFDYIIICTAATVQKVAERKGQFCRDEQVDMIFEDSPLYLSAVRAISPNTVCWQLLPVGGP